MNSPGEFCLLRKNQLRMHCRCLGDCPELLHHVLAAKPDKRVGAEHTLGGARSDFVAALWRWWLFALSTCHGDPLATRLT